MDGTDFLALLFGVLSCALSAVLTSIGKTKGWKISLGLLSLVLSPFVGYFVGNLIPTEKLRPLCAPRSGPMGDIACPYLFPLEVGLLAFMGSMIGVTLAVVLLFLQNINRT